MKKLFLSTVISFLCFGLFAIEAKVVSVTGKVQKQRGSAWVDLKPGDVVNKGEMIQTGFKSEAVLSLTSASQNSKITVTQLSRITIEQLAEGTNGDTASVAISSGSVKSDIQKTKDNRVNYSVRSPVATASVRGTVLGVTVNFNGTSIDAERGEVSAWLNGSNAGSSAEVSVPKGSQSVREGQSADFTNDGKISSPSKNSYINANVLGGGTEPLYKNEIDGNIKYTEIELYDSEYTEVGSADFTGGVEYHHP
ncbi:MAG: FecR domain-containing protein [Treponema sp.]|uniref:FecR family protein n=1 Tax=Treponema sp. TaxID=166 RepID=UPI001B69AF7A|nr:FecR domain-containing protein [Treponema sp.]MBP5403284.1 FecR domain-containing protein [Treponema sp.]MBR5932672.1 FecR domain-containing protein [Treponema sp.]